MATVNFSVPEEVKEAFNSAYQGQNKSAIIADLMREAVERFERKQRHRDGCKSFWPYVNKCHPSVHLRCKQPVMNFADHEACCR